jgi:hypothetical protein
MSVSASIAKMVEFGLTLEQALLVTAEFEASFGDAERSPRQKRNHRYYLKNRERLKTSELRRLKTSESVLNSDALAPTPPRVLYCEESNSFKESGSIDPPKKEEKIKTPLGCRLPDDWHANGAEMEFGQKLGLSEIQVREAEAEFMDFWRAVPGSRGRKLDWSATFRNRLRETAGKLAMRRKSSGNRPAKGSLIDAADRLIAEFEREELRAKAGGGDGAPPLRLLPGFGSE